MEKSKLGKLCDRLYQAQQRRLERQREADAEIAGLKAVEDKLTETIINGFSDQDLKNAGGDLCTVSVGLYVAPRVADWPAFYAYIKKQNAFELLERRPARAACRERWDAKVAIPGVEQFSEKRLYVNKKSNKE
jgi:hypothetical protein